MKLIPVMTEKSMKLTKDFGFTFWVPMTLTKIDIKEIVEKTFGVHVVDVRTVNIKARTKKSARGKVQKIKAGKKAMVFLKDGEKIDLFEEEKKVKKVKKAKKETK
jgi:large subunit ribosomal protein L23